MRIIAVGDTHGRDTWERIAAANLWDKFVFIGDYFDSREGISAAVQLENFKNIVAFKKRAPGSVVLLVGNHDFHYLGGISARYSGHQELYASEIREALEAARDSLQICFAADGHLFTHAGVTKTWCASNGVLTNDIEAGLNDLFRQNAIAFKFTPGINRDPTGDDITQSPIWVRPESLVVDAVDGWTQVVGHTQQDHVLVRDHIFIDTLGTSGESLLLDSGLPLIVKTP